MRYFTGDIIEVLNTDRNATACNIGSKYKIASDHGHFVALQSDSFNNLIHRDCIVLYRRPVINWIKSLFV